MQLTRRGFLGMIAASRAMADVIAGYVTDCQVFDWCVDSVHGNGWRVCRRWPGEWWRHEHGKPAEYWSDVGRLRRREHALKETNETSHIDPLLALVRTGY